jgi:hypothetical protein
MSEAAYTKHDAVYPGFVNVKPSAEGVTLTVRGDPQDLGGSYRVGPQATLKLTTEEWQNFLTAARRSGLL